MKTNVMALIARSMMCNVAVWAAALSMIWIAPAQTNDLATSDEPVDIEALGADVIPTEGEIITGGLLPEDTSWGNPDGVCELCKPVLVSPAGTLYHFPRVTTLVWRPVTGATYYVIERAYKSGTTWYPYSNVTVSGFSVSSYTFNFVGDQPGRWRVSACDSSACTEFSAWKTFSYSTKPQLYTPTQTSPAANLVFDHYPRTITLAWKPVVGTVAYKVERQYCSPSGSPCWDYAPVTVTAPSLTFDFVGAQPGKWRVTALSDGTHLDSKPSGWRKFSFTR